VQPCLAGEPGDWITLGAGRSLRVVDVRDLGDAEPVVLVVQDSSKGVRAAASESRENHSRPRRALRTLVASHSLGYLVRDGHAASLRGQREPGPLTSTR
jgi:hypothetical protein